MLITCSTVAVADNSCHIECRVQYELEFLTSRTVKTSEILNVTVHVH